VTRRPPLAVDETGAAPYVPDTDDLVALARAANGCEGCPLFANATRAVFGEGSPHAPILLVGEQPGDQEDRQGHPFVGPAGRVLWTCLEEAGVPRDSVFATNAVKHFKHETRGKRRIHQRPTADEIDACHPWLAAELAVVDASVVVALGATAVRGLLGRPLPIAANRGKPIGLGERTVLVTYHPSAVLRGEERAAAIRSALVDDLRAAYELVPS
jgi:uracil-DNA glycosylase family protein